MCTGSCLSLSSSPSILESPAKVAAPRSTSEEQQRRTMISETTACNLHCHCSADRSKQPHLPFCLRCEVSPHCRSCISGEAGREVVWAHRYSKCLLVSNVDSTCHLRVKLSRSARSMSMAVESIPQSGNGRGGSVGLALQKGHDLLQDLECSRRRHAT